MNRTASIVSSVMLLGGLPCSLFIFTFIEMNHAREVGHPYQGDAIGLAIMSVVSYGIALLSCVIGLIYFAVRIRHGLQLKLWQWIVGGYSLAQVIAPIFYFSTT